MSLRENIQQDIIIAMKSQDKEKLGVLRYLFSQIKDEEIAKGRKELTDEEIIKFISSLIKKLEESLVLYEKTQRKDLEGKAKSEINILKAYLPAQMSDTELENAITKIINDNKQINNPGALIGIGVKQLAGKADNSRIASMVMKKLNG